MKRILYVLLFLGFVLASTGSAQVERSQCRLSFGNSVRHYNNSFAIFVEICHRKRMLGAVAAPVDCNDPTSWAAAGYDDGAAAYVRASERLQAESAMCAPNVTSTSDVGYVGCPAPCDALPTTTFPEVGACLQCLVQAASQVALLPTLGTPPLPTDKVARKCQDTIGRGAVRYLNKRMLLQHGCQFLEEIAKPGFVGVDCRDVVQPAHPYQLRLQRSRSKLHDQIVRKCGTVNLSVALDTCGTDPDSESDCVLAALDQWTDSLFDVLFPPY